MYRNLLAFCVLALLASTTIAQVRDHVQLNVGTGFGNTDNDNEGIAVVHHDRSFVVFFSDEGGVNGNKDLYACVSTDEGVNFGAPIRVDTGNAAHLTNAENVRAVALDNGVILAIWEDSRGPISELIYYNYSLDGGFTWLASAQQLSANFDADAPDLAKVGNMAYAIWEQEPNESIEFASFDGVGLAWSSIVDIHNTFSAGAGSDVDDPVLTAGPNSINVVFTDGRSGDDTYALTSFDGGVSFFETALETVTGDDSDGTYGAQDLDLVCLAWIDQPVGNNSNDNHIMGVISNDGGATFGTEFSLTPDVTAAVGTVSGDVIWFHVDVKGSTICCTYAHDLVSVTNGGSQGQAGALVYSNTSTDGGVTWTGSVLIDSNTGNRPRSQVVSNDLIYVFYETGTNGSNGAAFAWSIDGGMSWSSSIVPSAQSADVDGSESDYSAQMAPLAVDPRSKRMVCAYNYNVLGGNDIYVASVRAPWAQVVDLGGSFVFEINDVPGGSFSYYFAVSEVGSTPTDLGSALPLVQLDLTPTTFLMLDPTLAPFFGGAATGSSAQTLAPLPSVPGVTFYGVGYAVSANGETYLTDGFEISL